MYKQHLNVAKDCGQSYSGCEKVWKIPHYKYLNGGDKALGIYPGGEHYPFWDSHTFILRDGVLVGIHFKESRTGVRWGTPSMYFAVDVNGINKGPNKIGRDLFFLHLDKAKTGRILPYTNEAFLDGGYDYRNTCEKDQKGFSCAYRIITEGKMNY